MSEIPFLAISTITLLLLITLWENKDSTSFLPLPEATTEYCLLLAKLLLAKQSLWMKGSDAEQGGN